ncbi:RNA polymerase sigma factor RpoH [Buchnera aphidicola]|uniref:RNA polymerase sigma factor RpoH n=1 Tax=Buchnera aphidicola TaxID=9 RepID=UPI0031B837AC
MYKIQTLQVLSLKNLRSYIHAVNSWTILSAQEEHKLTKKVYYDADENAARIVILSNLRFVVHIARTYSGYGLSQSDLIQEGNVGLMKAVRRFNPNINVRVISFAVHWIKSEIHEYIIKNWRIVKIATTKVQRKLFFNLRKTKNRLGWCNKHEISLIAKTLGVKNHDIQDMESRMSMQDCTLSLSVTDKNNQNIESSRMSYLKDCKSDFAVQIEKSNWNKYIFGKLNHAILNLDHRSRNIICLRWLNHKNKITLQEIAKFYGISAERVRQIENNAMRKLKKILEE